MRAAPGSWRWPTVACATAPACASSRAGPGLSNAMVSLHSAYHDATPMVMLVGQVERKDFGRLALQEQNYSQAAVATSPRGDRGERARSRPRRRSPAPSTSPRAARPAPVAVILPEDIFDEDNRRRLNPPRPRVVAGPRARGSGPPRRDAGEGGAAADPGRRRAAGRRRARPRGLRRPAPACRGMGAADQPDPSPAATVRCAASELRRLHGHPRAAAP